MATRPCGIGSDRRPESGFTLIELLAGIAILLFILIASYNVIDGSQRIATNQTERADMTSSGRVAMDLMASELREAGFNPNQLGEPQMTPANGAWITVDATKTLGEALDIRADLSGNGVTTAASGGANSEPNEWIRYEWTDVVNGIGSLVRWTDSDGNGTLDLKVVLAKNVLKATVSGTPQNIFTCYDRTGSTQITDKTRIDSDTKSVRIWFTVQAARRDRVTRKYPTVTLQSVVSLRNLRKFPL